MTRFTLAVSRFDERIKEVNHLKLMARRYSAMKNLLNNKDRVDHNNALVRSATVLLSSHIQGYIEDIAEVTLERLIYDEVSANLIPDSLRFFATRSAIEAIRETKDPDTTIKRIRNVNQYHEKIIKLDGFVDPSFLDSEYKNGFSNPTIEEVRKFLSRFGINDFDGQMGNRLKNEWPIVSNAVNQIVDRRNKIAHGDVQATLTVNELEAYIKLAKKFVRTTDRVITSSFRKKGCKYWN